MKRSRRDKLVSSTTSSTRNSNVRSWPRGASALLATAMLLLAFAPFQSAANADSLKQLNAQWAHVSSALVSSLGATDEATSRVQSEQLFLWMQTRAATFENPQNLSAVQVAALLDEWQVAQRGKISVQKVAVNAKQRQSSTRLCATSFLQFAFAPQITATFSSPRLTRASLPLHAAAKLSGVRTNRRHE